MTIPLCVVSGSLGCFGDMPSADGCQFGYHLVAEARDESDRIRIAREGSDVHQLDARGGVALYRFQEGVGIAERVQLRTDHQSFADLARIAPYRRAMLV